MLIFSSVKYCLMANGEHKLHSWKMLSLYVFLDTFLLVRHISFPFT